MEINVLIEPVFKNQLKPDWLKKVAAETLTAEGLGENIELGLFITAQDKITELNRKYRAKGEPTDVLAFAAEEGTSSTPFIEPPDGIRHLGEVVISYPQAVTQAEEHHHSVAKEIAILIIHGVLHLLGYEHDEPENERKMKAKEEEILNRLKEPTG